MLYRLQTKLGRQQLLFSLRRMLSTPPIKYREENWTILSMISHNDLVAYLLAVKSFYAQIGGGKILIVSDGSLTSEDEEILRTHLVAPKIIYRNSIRIGRFLQHIMWERLASALDLSEQEYVMQLDADTVTVGPLDDVRACITENRAFTLGTWNGLEVVSAQHASDYARKSKSNHIQIQVERALQQLPKAGTLMYVRGSAGLAGLARGGFKREAAEEFCEGMCRIFGERFSEWGTDQIAFNFIVANSPTPCVLPYPKYACFGPELDIKQPAFFHFIGTYRYRQGIYARLGRQFVRTALAG